MRISVYKIMVNKLKSIMTEKGAHDIKYLKAYGIKDAHGIIKNINLQINRDLMIVPPNSLSTPSERVHPLRWAGIREFLAVENHVSRATKETIAATISELNTCPYCQDAHETAITALGDSASINDDIDSLIEWSKNTLNPQADIIKNPPFGQVQAPEIIGTALLFHSTNRLVSIFAAKSLLPGILDTRLFKQKALNFAAKTLMKAFVEKQLSPGDSLQFIGEQVVPKHLQWAESLPAYGQIYAAIDSKLIDIEKDVIPPSAAKILKQVISTWQGEDMPLGRGWISKLTNNLNDGDKATTNLMLLAAFAPYIITKKDIQAFRKHNHSDKDLLEICYWSIEMLTNKISIWLTKPFIQSSRQLS